MSWLDRLKGWWQERRQAPDAQGRRVVVISDIHLGEEVGDSREPNMPLIAAVNRELPAFLDALRRSPSPLTLIINGDSIDFLRTTVLPNPLEARLLHTAPLTPREARLGLDSSRTTAAWKLSRLVGYHRPIFQALARLLADGHELVVIRGNHDVELYWPEVRQALVDTLVGMAGPGAEGIAARVRFEPWFYYIPGLLYAEHGHQYDPHCSYLDLLDPVEDEGRMLALPYAQWSIRYFAPLLHNAPAAAMEEWTFFEFLRYALTLPPARFIKAAVIYFRLVADVLARKSWRHTVGRPRTQARHRHRLEKLAEGCGLPLATVQRLDGLKERPVEERFLGMTLAFYLDRFLLLTATLLLIGIAALLPISPWIRVLIALLVLLAGTGLHELLRKLRTRDAEPRLHQKALLIGRLVEVPFVTFGHSHQAEIQPEKTDADTPPRCFYINSGHWAARYADTAWTYVDIEVSAAQGPVARLMRWRGADQPAEELGRAAPTEVEGDADPSAVAAVDPGE